MSDKEEMDMLTKINIRILCMWLEKSIQDILLSCVTYKRKDKLYFRKYTTKLQNKVKNKINEFLSFVLTRYKDYAIFIEAVSIIDAEMRVDIVIVPDKKFVKFRTCLKKEENE